LLGMNINNDVVVEPSRLTHLARAL
jgi:hypothetical protein